MDLNSWIGLAFGVLCACIAHLIGKRSGRSAFQEDIKVRLKEIQRESERESGEIKKQGDEQLKAIDKLSANIKSADDDALVDQFNDAFSGK